MILKSEDINNELYSLKLYGYTRGVEFGFGIDYSFKAGFYTHICADPHAGKTEFVLSLAKRLSEKSKILLFTPETGKLQDVYYELIWKHQGNRIENLSEADYEAAKYLIDQKYNIIDSTERLTIENIFYFWTGEDYIIIDGITNVKHEKQGKRDDEYLDEFYQNIQNWLKQNSNVHIIFTIHPRDRDTQKEDNINYLPAPKGRDARMGQSNYRNAYGWINLWRPKKGLRDEHGIPYHDNAMQVHVEKAKPKGVGRFDEKYLIYFHQSISDYTEHESYYEQLPDPLKTNDYEPF